MAGQPSCAKTGDRNVPLDPIHATMPDARAELLQQAIAVFRKQKALGDRAMDQLSDDQLFEAPDIESNSVAVIVKHMHGNMRSRWTDFLISDGEKPDRDRDSEFLAPADRSRAQVREWWERGWACVFAALSPLEPHEVEATVRIRNEPVTVAAAILRQLDHYGQHVGQIIYLAKHLRGSDWKSLSIPRGKSEEFNQRMMPK